MKEKQIKKAVLKGMEQVRDKSKQWKKPTLEDVSGRVMAQPYIRFT
jgi:hypothetical protein